MRKGSALAVLAVAACFAVGTPSLAQSQANSVAGQTVFLPASLVPYAAPLGEVAPSLLSGEMRALLANRNPLRNLETTAVLAPGFDVNAGAGVGMTGRVNGFDSSADNTNNGLFLTSSAAPYSAAVSGGNFAGATLALAGDL